MDKMMKLKAICLLDLCIDNGTVSEISIRSDEITIDLGLFLNGKPREAYIVCSHKDISKFRKLGLIELDIDPIDYTQLFVRPTFNGIEFYKKNIEHGKELARNYLKQLDDMLNNRKNLLDNDDWKRIP